MTKWRDENGTDIDAYPERAFQGGVYNGGVFGNYPRNVQTIDEYFKPKANDKPKDISEGNTKNTSGPSEGD